MKRLRRNTRRAILATLIDAGPLTAKGVAAACGADERTAANLCSSMACSGLLSEHPNDRGGRHGRKYDAAAAILPEDVRVISDLVTAYGAKIVRKFAQECATKP